MNSEVASNAANLPWTGERYMPGMGGRIAVEHGARYIWANRFVRGKSVLDIACGEGYGSATLANVAEKVIGVDILQSAVDHANSKYAAVYNLNFRTGSLHAIPLQDNSIDVIVCFETIEHIKDQERAFEELVRVLKSDGILLISTPNREVYSERYGYKNPFHENEFSLQAFEEALSLHFKTTRVFQQTASALSTIEQLNQSELQTPISLEIEMKELCSVSGHRPGKTNFAPIYFLAVCANQEPEIPAGLLGMTDFSNALLEDEMIIRKALEGPDVNETLVSAYLRLLDQSRVELFSHKEALARLRQEKEDSLKGLRNENDNILNKLRDEYMSRAEASKLRESSARFEVNALKNTLKGLQLEHRLLWKRLEEAALILSEKETKITTLDSQLNSMIRSTSWRALFRVHRFFDSRATARKFIRRFFLLFSKHGELQ